jgi:uncharacterized membrane protein YfcA
MEISLLVLFGIVIVIIAGFFQGLTSFGFALISMPILAVIIPVKEVVPIVVILCLFTNLIILANCFRYVEIKKIWILLLASFLAAPLGAYSLRIIDSDILKLISGILILAVSMLLLAGKVFQVKNENIAFIPVGFTSGFLNGSISMSGPPVVLFLTNQGVLKEAFRANITAYFLILNLFTIAIFFFGGLLTGSVLSYSLWFLPSMIIGVVLGNITISKVDNHLFRKIALWLIFISGAWTIITTIMSILRISI